MSNPYSKEQKQLSQESLQEALIDLMRHKKFNAISISELAKRAGISRMAFYRNYDTKEDVLSDYFDHYITPFYESLDAIPNKKAPVIGHAYFEYVDHNSELFELLLKSEAEAVLTKRFTFFVNQFYNDNATMIPSSDEYARLRNSFAAVGLYNITIEWIKGGKVLPISDLVKITTQGSES